jgi:purine-nucleoside phosphorylase
MRPAVDFLLTSLPIRPLTAVVLGSGLGAFADTLDDAKTIPYRDIPGWPQSTAVGHSGKMVAGFLAGLPVIALAGRAHLYEGYSAHQVVYGVGALAEIGVKSLVLTNAAGGINPAFVPGTLAVIADHINLTGQNPLLGPNDDSLGPRFPDMSEAYAKGFRDIARETAAAMGLTMPEGVYAGLLGPNYETPAEIRYLRAIGADLVGMSTVPEAIAANHMGMKVLGISCVTNFAAGVIEQKLHHREVLEVGERMKGTIVELLRRVLPRLV